MATQAQKIATAVKEEISFNHDNFKSMVFTNTHSANPVTIDIWITDQTGSNVTATDVYTTAYSASIPGTSVDITVDNGSGSASDAADDEFLNEKVYQSDGTNVGVCTNVVSTTSLRFGSGLVKSLADNTILHVGSRFYFLNNVVIPNGASLQITSDDFDFDNTNYNCYITASAATVDVIIKY